MKPAWDAGAGGWPSRFSIFRECHPRAVCLMQAVVLAASREALTAHATLNAIEALDFDEEFITALQKAHHRSASEGPKG